MKDTSFHDYVVYDLLGSFPNISSKAMFGGHGVYSDGKIFAIVVDGELYVKGYPATETFFTSRGSHQFTYSKGDGKAYAMRYWHVPEEVYEDRDTFEEWVMVAISGSQG